MLQEGKVKCAFVDDDMYRCEMLAGEPVFNVVVGVKDDMLGIMTIKSSLVDVERECTMEQVHSSLERVVMNNNREPSVHEPDNHGKMDVLYTTRSKNIKDEKLESLMTAFTDGLMDAQENCPLILFKSGRIRSGHERSGVDPVSSL